MKREWKPGDVAMVTWDDASQSMLARGESNVRTSIALRDATNEGWSFPASMSGIGDFPVIDARPLVVIDPEDREQVERLVSELRQRGIGQMLMTREQSESGSVDEVMAEHVRNALADLVTPPKPDEPQGKYAEVENSEGMTYYRSPSGEWHRATDDFVRPWSHIGAVRILSEGVQP